MILVTDAKISSVYPMMKILEYVASSQESLVIISDNLEGEALSTIILNKLRGQLKVAAVKAPGFGDNRKAILQDIASLTGAEFISEELGMKLDTTEPTQLGRAKKITITKDDTIIMEGAGSKEAVDERISLIKSALERTTSDYEKEKLQERMAKMVGGVAVVKVGGSSEIEVTEKKERITDALNATKAAVEEGIVPGGGCAYLYASRSLHKQVKTSNLAQEHGVKILQRALAIPAKTIVDNAGEEGELIVGKLRESTDENLGYDAQHGEFVNMFDRGIVDPMKVVRTAVVDAASVAGLLTTAEAAVVELPKKDEPGPPMGGGMGGGMGGMGGMGGYDF